MRSSRVGSSQPARPAPGPRLGRPLALCALALLCACTDPVDKAAKKRIFSPEDPPKVIAAAGEDLHPEQAANDPRITRRLLQMSASEATERLGPHEYNATVTFEWTGGNNQAVKLSERRTLVAGKGGVNGNFDARVSNSREVGLEVLRVDGQVFAKDLYGKFRRRMRDRGMAERTREDTFGALRDVDALFARRLRLSPKGSTTYEGRSALRYQVTLADASAPEPTTVAPPPPQYARGGMDESTKRRRAFTDKRKARGVQGEVVLDAQTGVVLKARVDGRLEVPAEKGKPAAALHLTLDSALTRVGRTPDLKLPTDFLPDVDKPSGIADALDRFGIPRGGHADAGVDSDMPDEEP